MASHFMSRRTFVSLGGMTTGFAALASIAGCRSESGESDSDAIGVPGCTVEVDLEDMVWDDILAEAAGQTVVFLTLASDDIDPLFQQWWDKLAEDVKEKYDVTIEYSEFDQAKYDKIITDLENGTEATYDMFWGNASTTAPIRTAGNGVFGNKWITKLDNYKYLDQSSSFVTFDGVDTTKNEELAFLGLSPSLIYSTDNWDHTIDWDQEKDGKGGLPANFTELAAWTIAHPGKFTYIDPTGSDGIHGLFFLKAILAELASDGENGWKPIYNEEDDVETRRKKIETNIDRWRTWSTSPNASEETFYEKADYLWAYLKELAPYLLQTGSSPTYIESANDMMSHVIVGDLACAFTTCASIYERHAVEPNRYPTNPAIYMLQTSVGAWDYLVITSNSLVKAGAMVVANEMLDPSQQAIAFQATGNVYNVAYNKLGSKQKELDDVFAIASAQSSSAAEIAQRSYNDRFGLIEEWPLRGWAQNVRD